MRPALFLDRDGVINHDFGYVYRKSDFRFIPGIFEVVRFANELGLSCIVVTNQAGIGRGFYTENDFLNLTDWMCDLFQEHNAQIDAVYYCPFHPIHGKGKYRRESFDRKPSPGMILKASVDLDLDLKRSTLVGDKASDMQAADRAGIEKKVLFTAGSKLQRYEGEAQPSRYISTHCHLIDFLGEIYR